jgi:maleate isomerase
MTAFNVSLSNEKPKYELPQASKKLGLITLSTDLTTERDFARLIPMDQAGFYGTRVEFTNPTTPENLRKMGPKITEAANLILPEVELDAICYSCTAASIVIGDDTIKASINAARPDVPVVTPSGAALMAFKTMSISHISILTPYLVETSIPMANYFSQNGLDIERFNCFGIEDDRDMARVTHDSIIKASLAIDSPQTEAFFLSCTGLPAIGVIAEIEDRTGKPVVTSNQASAWALMRHAGLHHNPKNYGRLFEYGLPNNV